MKMKKSLLYILIVSSSVLWAVGCGTKSELDNDMSSTKLAIKMLMPEAVEPGGVLSITGSKLSTVKEVIFPGNRSVSSFKMVGETQIDVIVPADVQPGQVSITDGETTVTSEQQIHLAVPRNLTYSPVNIKTKDILTIRGENLAHIVAVRLGKDFLIASRDFVRKNLGVIKVVLPFESPIGEGVELVLIDGKGVETPLGKLNIEKGIPQEVWIPFMEDPVDLADWGNNIYIPKARYKDILNEETVFKIDYVPTSANVQFKICSDSKWAGFPSLSNNSWGGLDIKGVTGKASEYRFSLEAAEIEECMGASNMVLQGKNAIINQISYLRYK